MAGNQWSTRSKMVLVNSP